MVGRRAALAAAVALAAAMPVAAQTLATADRVLVTSFGDVAALALGRDHLFLAGDAGIAVRDVLQERWLPPLAPVPGYPPPGYATALAYDPIGDGLWLGLDTGELFQLSFAFGEWTRASFQADGPIIRIRPDAAEGALWVGTPAGWYRVRDDGGFGRFMIRADMVPEEVRRSGEQNLGLLAVQGTLGTDDRLRRYDLTDAIAGESPGTFYVGTAGGGVVRVDTNTLDRTWLQFGTLSRGLGSVAVDGDRLWFGGDGGGPRDGVAWSPRDLSTWTRYEAGVDDAPRGFVARIAASPEGTWFATSEGVYRFDDEDSWLRLTARDGLPADQGTSVVPTGSGAWIGTLRGLARVDTSGTVVSTSLDGARVLDLALAGETLWVATDRGLFTRTGEGDPVAVSDTPALATGPVVAVATDGDVVAALTPDALHVRRNGRWAAPDRTLAPLGALLRLHIDPEGGLWVAGANGIASLESARAPRTWLVPGDIPEGPVRGLTVDGDHLWVATPAGALRIDRTR